MTIEKLNQIRNEAKKRIDLRLTKAGAHLYVGAGDCGIEHGSRNTLAVILDEVSKLALENVTVTQMGCIGECEYEPIVEIKDADGQSYVYGKVDADVAKEIVSSHLSGGKVVEASLLKNLKK